MCRKKRATEMDWVPLPLEVLSCFSFKVVPVLIHPGGYDNASQIGQLVNNRNLFLTVLGSGSSGSGVTKLTSLGWWESSSWVVACVFSLWLHMGEEAGALCGIFFIKKSNGTNEGSTLMTWDPPKSPTSWYHPSPLDVRISTYEFWGRRILTFLPLKLSVCWVPNMAFFFFFLKHFHPWELCYFKQIR